MVTRHNEAFARVLIDKALEFSGWDLLDSKQVVFEYNAKSGRADYLLKDSLGRVLAVLEAKREDNDPYDAKEQGRGYAENHKAPFVILSNGRVHYLWNLERADQQDAIRIERLPSREDLERMRLRNMQPPRPLASEVVGPDYLRRLKHDLTLRRYQIKAMDEIAANFDAKGLRKFLLEMATGTGKTLLCAALIRRFLVSRNAERVLFIVDRIELAKQTMEDFAVVLPEFKPVIFKTARRNGELLGSSVVIATIQSLMTDRRYREEFTPFYFDLVINDEAHRSIYGDAREVVQFFQATRIGLTATPKAYLKNINARAPRRREPPSALESRQLRDTYHYFGCEPGQPTYRYDIIDAVQDPEGPFLCLPKIFDLRSDITTQALAEAGWAVVDQRARGEFQDPGPGAEDLHARHRNRVMCEAFLKEAQRDPSGEIGKSIVFAVNQTHATALTKIFNELAARPRPHDHLAHPRCLVARQGLPRRQAPRAHRRVRTTCCEHRLQLPRPAQRRAHASGLFADRVHPDQGPGHASFHVRRGQHRVREEAFLPARFLRRGRVLRGEIRLHRSRSSCRAPEKRQAAVQVDGGEPRSWQVGEDSAATDSDQPGAQPRREIPVWEGTDRIVTQEVRIVGPNGEKVDIMTFRGSFERDLKEFAEENADLQGGGGRRGRRRHRDHPTASGSTTGPRCTTRPTNSSSPTACPPPTPAFVYNARGQAPAADSGSHRSPTPWIPSPPASTSATVNSQVAARHRRTGGR